MPAAVPVSRRPSFTRSRRLGSGVGGVVSVFSVMGTSVGQTASSHHWEWSLRGAPPRSDMASGMILTMFERYTPSARQVIAYANEEARSLRHSSLGVEHLLLGILLDDVGHGGRALRGVGLSAEAVRTRIGELAPPGPPT